MFVKYVAGIFSHTFIFPILFSIDTTVHRVIVVVIVVAVCCGANKLSRTSFAFWLERPFQCHVGIFKVSVAAREEMAGLIVHLVITLTQLMCCVPGMREPGSRLPAI